MTRSNKRKNVKNHAHHSSNPKSKTKGNHVMRVFMMYFVIFGTILAFIGFMGDDSLPDSNWFIWLLVLVNFIISTIATISHMKSGKKTKIDEISEKW
jgi:protein-S-isoprenylcysteine O-methyltransferase Ste14|tara:strand:+ start:256 stop:546 length:291 start_codon:yes stop_codon:yes gene_type:complete